MKQGKEHQPAWQIFTDEARRALLRAQAEASGGAAPCVTHHDLACGIIFEPLLQGYWWFRLLTCAMLCRKPQGKPDENQEPGLSKELARSLSRCIHDEAIAGLQFKRVSVPYSGSIGLEQLCDAISDQLKTRPKLLLQIAYWLFSIGLNKSPYVALKGSINLQVHLARFAFASGVFLILASGVLRRAGPFGDSAGFVCGLVLVGVLFPMLAFHSQWRLSQDFREVARYFAATAACLAVMFPASIAITAPRNVASMEWFLIVVAAVFASIPITAISVIYQFPTYRSAREQAYDTAMAVSAASRQDTNENVTRWQSEGLMPEVDRGSILVWKAVCSQEQSGSSTHKPERYLGFLQAEYRINQTYHYPYSMVCAGPFGVLKTHVQVGCSGYLIAVLARKDVLESAAQPGVFFAHMGRPVAAYRAKRITEDSFEYTLLEGTDAMQWIKENPAS